MVFWDNGGGSVIANRVKRGTIFPLIVNSLLMRMGGVRENIQSFRKDQVDSIVSQPNSFKAYMATFTDSEFFHATCYLTKKYSSL